MSKLMKAQKKAQNADGDLKSVKDALVAEVKRRENSDNKAAKALLEVTDAQQRMDEVVWELIELKKVASAQVYQKFFDRGFN